MAEGIATAQVFSPVLADELRRDAVADGRTARSAGRHQRSPSQDRAEHRASA